MSYWQERTLRNEAKAHKLADSYSKRIKSLHNQQYRKLNAYLDSLMKEVENGGILSRSELWRSKKYIDLINAIAETEQIIATEEVKLTQACLERVFEQTVGSCMKDFGSTFSNAITERLEAQVINSTWCGTDFSARIWHNANALAARLENDMREMILSGKDIHKQLMRDMSVSYHEADRLIRTESAHIYTEASKTAYREANIQKVEWLAEADACEICDSYNGKQWPIDEAPMLPVHPNCRCCLLPVV